MIVLNNRQELVSYLYGNMNIPFSLVGIAIIAGDLFNEAMNSGGFINHFSSRGGDEFIQVSTNGEVMQDRIQ